MLSDMIAENTKFVDDIFNKCREDGWNNILFVSNILILVTGVVANIALLWLFLRDRKSMSASKILGLNLAVMDLIYLSVMPFSLIQDSETSTPVNSNRSDWQSSNTTYTLDKVIGVFSAFNQVGCPLLLTCMCIERYLAVVRPVLYLRMRKWEYRMAVSAVVWVLTLSFCVAAGLVHKVIILPTAIIISCLFILMLACLGGVVWSLLQQSPAHTAHGNQARSESPLKRRAVVNVLVVVVPAVVAYLPVLAIVPLVIYIYLNNTSLTRALCNVLQLCLSFPRNGVLIGPLFYLSRARQMCYCCETGKTFNE